MVVAMVVVAMVVLLCPCFESAKRMFFFASSESTFFAFTLFVLNVTQ